MSGSPDPGSVAGGLELLAFVDAVVARRVDGLSRARTRLTSVLSERAVTDAAAVIAEANAFNRISAATGTEVNASVQKEIGPVLRELGLDPEDASERPDT